MLAVVGSMRGSPSPRSGGTSEIAPAIPAKHCESEESPALGLGHAKLGALESDAPSYSGNVFDAFEARRHFGPFVVVELGRGNAGG
jgi:hypothetical protein